MTDGGPLRHLRERSAAVRKALGAEDFAAAMAAFDEYRAAVLCASAGSWSAAEIREAERDWEELREAARAMVAVFRENARAELARCAAARNYGERRTYYPAPNSTDLQG